MSVFCKNCNKELREDEKPCSVCGEKGRKYVMVCEPAKFKLTGLPIVFILEKRREFFEKNHKILWPTIFFNLIILVVTSFITGPVIGFIIGILFCGLSFFVIPPVIIKRVEITKEIK